MKLFSKQESVMFSNPRLSLDLFFGKKKIKTVLETKISTTFFPTCKTSIFLVVESQGLYYEELRKIEPSDHCQSEIKGRAIGRKAIFKASDFEIPKPLKPLKFVLLKAILGASIPITGN